MQSVVNQQVPVAVEKSVAGVDNSVDIENNEVKMRRYYRDIAREFIRQYHTSLAQDRNNLFRFYSSESTLLHEGLFGCAKIVVGQGAIKESIGLTKEEQFQIKINSFHVVESCQKSLLIHLMGTLITTKPKNFSQSILLMPQGVKKYYLHTDIFMYTPDVSDDVEVPPQVTFGENQPSTVGGSAPIGMPAPSAPSSVSNAHQGHMTMNSSGVGLDNRGSSGQSPPPDEPRTIMQQTTQVVYHQQKVVEVPVAPLLVAPPVEEKIKPVEHAVAAPPPQQINNSNIAPKHQPILNTPAEEPPTTVAASIPQTFTNQQQSEPKSWADRIKSANPSAASPTTNATVLAKPISMENNSGIALVTSQPGAIMAPAQISCPSAAGEIAVDSQPIDSITNAGNVTDSIEFVSKRRTGGNQQPQQQRIQGQTNNPQQQGGRSFGTSLLGVTNFFIKFTSPPPQMDARMFIDMIRDEFGLELNTLPAVKLHVVEPRAANPASLVYLDLTDNPKLAERLCSMAKRAVNQPNASYYLTFSKINNSAVIHENKPNERSYNTSGGSNNYSSSGNGNNNSRGGGNRPGRTGITSHSQARLGSDGTPQRASQQRSTGF